MAKKRGGSRGAQSSLEEKEIQTRRDRPLRTRSSFDQRQLALSFSPSPSLFHHPSLISLRRIARDDHPRETSPTETEVSLLFPLELLGNTVTQFPTSGNCGSIKMDTRRCSLCDSGGRKEWGVREMLKINQLETLIFKEN